MVVLYKYIPAWGLPDISPFCIKLETYLRMAKVPYETALGDPSKAPKRKLPYIEHDGRKIGDSSLIIDYLKATFGDPLDAGMTERERALCQAARSMLEEHLYFVVLHERWQQDKGWAVYVPTMREYARKMGAPRFVDPLLLPMIRRSVVKALHGQGMGRHGPEEVTFIGKSLIDTLSELLGEGPYFCGTRVRTIDATVYAFLAALIVPPFDSDVQRHARTKPNLVTYCDRLRGEIA